MTGPEHNDLAKLNARLFGLDGSGEEGAIGRIEARMDRMETTMNRWIGALALAAGVGGFLGLAGLKDIIVALATKTQP